MQRIFHTPEGVREHLQRRMQPEKKGTGENPSRLPPVWL